MYNSVEMTTQRTKVQSNDYMESGWSLGATGLSTTKEGYLQGRICVTGAGVFKYYDETGKVRYRLRSVDEVRKATAGLNSQPLTLRHPKDLVSPKNFKDVAVGFAGTDADFDGLNCFVTVTVTDEAAIRAIREGKVKAVSCGYESFINDDSGTWQGSDYDQVQEGIEYNHIALVLEGRAGDGVKFRLNDAVGLWDVQKDSNNQQRKESMQRKIQIDSVEYEADEAVIDALKKAQKDSADKQKALDTVTAERDAAKASCDEKDKKIKALEDAAASQDIKSMVKARIAIEKVADSAGIEKAEEMDDKAIKAAVIGKAFEGISLDGKSEDYVSAMFDAAVAKGFKNGQADNTLDADKIVNKDSKEVCSDESVDAARNAFAKSMRGEGDK